MKRVFSSADPAQIHLFRDVLEAEGIESEVVSQDVYGPFGPGAFVMVSPDDYEAAMAIVAEFEAPAPQDPWKWRCECGEDVEEQFAACWKCGKERRRD